MTDEHPTPSPPNRDPPTGDPPVGDPPIGDPPVGDPPVQEPPPKPPVEDPPPKDPPAEDPPSKDPPLEDPPPEDPPFKDPPVEDPPIKDPPAEDPPGQQRTAKLHEPSVHKPSVCEPSAHEPSLREPPLRESSLHEPSVRESSLHEPSARESSLHEPSVREPPMREPPVHGSSLLEPPVRESSGLEPSAREPPLRESSGLEPPVHESSLHEPSVREPPLRESSVCEPSARESSRLEPSPADSYAGAARTSALEPDLWDRVAVWLRDHGAPPALGLLTLAMVAIYWHVFDGEVAGDDLTFHMAESARLADCLRVGDFDFWNPSANAGFASLYYYQAVPQLASAIPAAVFGHHLFFFELSVFLPLVLAPAAAYRGMRLLGATPWQAVLAALAVGFINGESRWGTGNAGTFHVGLYTQTWALAAFPIALGHAVRWATQGRSLAAAIAWGTLVTLCHPFAGISLAVALVAGWLVHLARAGIRWLRGPSARTALDEPGTSFAPTTRDMRGEHDGTALAPITRTMLDEPGGTALAPTMRGEHDGTGLAPTTRTMRDEPGGTSLAPTTRTMRGEHDGTALAPTTPDMRGEPGTSFAPTARAMRDEPCDGLVAAMPSTPGLWRSWMATPWFAEVFRLAILGVCFAVAWMPIWLTLVVDYAGFGGFPHRVSDEVGPGFGGLLKWYRQGAILDFARPVVLTCALPVVAVFVRARFLRWLWAPAVVYAVWLGMGPHLGKTDDDLIPAVRFLGAMQVVIAMAIGAGTLILGARLWGAVEGSRLARAGRVLIMLAGFGAAVVIGYTIWTAPDGATPLVIGRELLFGWPTHAQMRWILLGGLAVIVGAVAWPTWRVLRSQYGVRTGVAALAAALGVLLTFPGAHALASRVHVLDDFEGSHGDQLRAITWLLRFQPPGRKQVGKGAENHWWNLLSYEYGRRPSLLMMGGGGLQASPNYDFLWTVKDFTKNAWVYDAPILVFQTSNADKLPAGEQILATRHYTARRLPAPGLVSPVQVTGTLPAGRKTARAAAIAWLKTDEPLKDRVLAYDGAGGAGGEPHGTVLRAFRQPSPGDAADIYAEVKATAPTTFMARESWHPRWRAYLDGAPTTIRRVTPDFPAIDVPAGHHVIALRFERPWWAHASWLAWPLVPLVAWLALRRASTSPRRPARA